MTQDPRKIINEARQAVQDKNYALALEKYQWFYENAIKIDKRFFGVRLSYCLHEWAELGKNYPEALNALAQLEELTLSQLIQEDFSFEKFQEYSSIAEYLGYQEKAFKQFLEIEKISNDRAKRLFTHVYEYCASEKMWGICSKYINADNQYQRSLELFDHVREFYAGREDTQSLSQNNDSFKKEILWILNMLTFGHTSDDHIGLLTKIETDLTERNLSYLYTEIQNEFNETIAS